MEIRPVGHKINPGIKPTSQAPRRTQEPERTRINDTFTRSEEVTRSLSRGEATSSPEDKLSVAGALLFIPLIFSSVASALRENLNRLLSFTNYRKKLETVLFKENNLSFDNFDVFVKRLKDNPDMAKKLFEFGVKRMDQMKNYDNKFIDQNSKKGQVTLRDKNYEVIEKRTDYPYYMYHNRKRGVIVSVSESLFDNTVYVSAYKPLEGSFVEMKTVPITLSGDKVSIGKVMHSVKQKDSYWY